MWLGTGFSRFDKTLGNRMWKCGSGINKVRFVLVLGFRQHSAKTDHSVNCIQFRDFKMLIIGLPGGIKPRQMKADLKQKYIYIKRSMFIFTLSVALSM